MTAAQFRRIALSLEGVEEYSHAGLPAFRVGGRKFASLASQAWGYGNLMLTLEQQAAFVEEAPEIFLSQLILIRGRGCRNAALDELRLNLEFLICNEVHFSLKSLVSGQTDCNLACSWCDQQRFADPTKLCDVAHKKTVYKDCCPLRDNGKFDFCSYRRNLHPQILLHCHSDDLLS